MCSNTRHATTASNEPSANGSASAPALPGGEPGDLALAGADVEDAVVPGQQVRRDGQDLLLVLRVRPVGEALLPPAGVRFPQVDVVSHRRDGTRPAARAGTVAADA
jgi:hypothetical protein